jgi:opacity protein-like surface antigen
MMRFLVAALLLAALPSAASAAPLFGEKGESFPKGTKALEFNGAYINPIRFSVDDFYGANFAGHYYFGDEVSLGLELQGYFVDQEEHDTELGGASLVLRWHFLASENYTLFFDGGLGGSYSGFDVPEDGTHFNYTARGGGGITRKLRDDLHLLGGVRFWHLSNGNLHGRDENPSQDGVQYFIGLMFTF